MGADRLTPKVNQGHSVARQVAHLALPVLVEQALLYLVGLSDTILTGRYLGTDDLAAVTVCSYLLWSLGSLLMIVSAGSTALVARLIGADDRATARLIVRQSFGLAVIVGMLLLVAGWAGAPALVTALNLTGSSADAAVRYFRIVLASTPLLACLSVGNACLRGAGDARTGMWIMAVVNFVNVTLSWGLVVGAFGVPQLGLAGVAVGTTAGQGVGGLLMIGILVLGRSGLNLGLRRIVPERESSRRILRISLPAAGESLVNSLCQLWFLALINRLGETATAAHGVAIRLEAIAFLTISAFAVAASTLTGQHLGAGRPDLAQRATSTAWGAGVLILSGLGAILFSLAAPMFGLFLGRSQEGVAEMGVPVLRLVAFALPALATINVLNGTFRGAGDTRWPLAIVLLGYLLVRMPLTYLLARPEALGLYGAWVAMFADLHLRAGLVMVRFHQGGWKQVEV